VGSRRSRPTAARGGGRRPAFTAAPYPAKIVRRLDEADCRIVSLRISLAGAERSILSELTKSACGIGVHQSIPACVDEVSCRMFLCGRCRSQVLVCRRCDRGQIYCIGTCAQEARRERQREARRRHQATARGRAMHADRNRRYRARVRCMTDHGAVKAQRTAALVRLEVFAVPSEASSSIRSSTRYRCHHCGHSASAFVRRSALRPRSHRGKKSDVGRGDKLRTGPP
jgi:hypothetical protein